MSRYILIISFFVLNMSFAQDIDSIQEGIVTIDASSEITKMIERKINYNATIDTKTNNYRIQLFYGSESGAIRTQAKFEELFPNTTSDLEFDSPNWKIKVGNYKTRLIADKHLQTIIQEFDDAIVIEPKK